MDTVKQLQEIKKKQLKKLNASANDLDSPLASGQNSPGTLIQTIYLKNTSIRVSSRQLDSDITYREFDE